MDRRSSGAIVAAGLAAVAAVGSVVAAALHENPRQRLIDGHVGAGALVAVLFSVLGAVIVRRLPGNRLGWLCFAIGVSGAVSGLITEYGHRAVIANPGSLPAGSGVASLDAWIWFPGFAAIITLLVAWFPDGRLHGRWVCLPVAVAGLGSVLFVGATSVMAWRIRGPAIFTEDRVDDGSALAGVADVGLVLVLVGAAGCVGAAGARLRGSYGRERQQLLWFGAGAAVCVAVLGVGGAGWGGAAVAELVALPMLALGIGIALFRYRLLDIEFVVNRVVLYGTLAVAIGVLYAGAVAVATRWLDISSVLASVVAAGLVAVTFDWVRRRLEQVADRLMFANRHNPARAMAELSRRIAAAGNPDMLGAIAGAVVSTLAVRGARVELDVPEFGRLAGNAGQLDDPTVALPLTFDGRRIGTLYVEDDAGAPVDASTRSLLADLAAQAGVAARAVLLAVELQGSRTRLVSAIEQERRRLRRDLHDGLGTALVGIVMQLEALGNLLDASSPGAPLLRTIEGEVRQLVIEARRLVHGLVPPVVEELGLIEALRQHADRLNRSGGKRGAFEVCDGTMRSGSLPAAVELAAYAVATEAMTNVARHARAHRCTVKVCHGSELKIEVVDDGIGIDNSGTPGVGLRSMRERTEELGGTLLIEPHDPMGTRVVATLPLVVV